jgi:GTP-binding protein EngB required for normal cell division
MQLQLGKKPPVLTLVDMPGYGHAVASDAQKRAWGNMTRDYLQVLHCSSVLIYVVTVSNACGASNLYLQVLVQIVIFSRVFYIDVPPL